MRQLKPKTGPALAGAAMLATAIVGSVSLAQEPLLSVADALKLEAADALPQTPFYDTPANLGATRAGDLLRREPFAGYGLPAGARAVRILYHSQDADGRDVATSGVVLIPAGAPPAGGWPVIAWAHGTSGVARQCAPSLMKDVYYGEEGVMPMVRAGYAVVATDYHGLGTEGPHQYVNKAAQTNDVIFSIPAARAAVPELGRRWVVDGHSQGGMAAWGVAEREARRGDTDYLGAVAVAPASRLRQVLSRPAGPASNGFYIDYIAWAVRALTPGFKPSSMLTGAALARFDDLSSKGCFYYGYARFRGDAAPPVLKSGWDRAPAVRRFFRENVIGRAPIAGPLLVVAGEADRTVPLAAVRAAVKSVCVTPRPVQLRTYPGLDHDPAMEKSTPDQLAWIGDRFAGKPAPATCPAGGG